MFELNNEINTNIMAKNIYYILKKVLKWNKEKNLFDWLVFRWYGRTKLALILLNKKKRFHYL